MKPGDLYKHFKGNVYRIVTLATREEDMELLVVYERADGSSERPWVRTASSFLSITPKGEQRFAPFTAELPKPAEPNEVERAVLAQLDHELFGLGMPEANRSVAIKVIVAAMSAGQQLRSLSAEEDIVIATFSPWLRMEMNDGRCLLRRDGDSYSYMRRVTTPEEALSFIQGLNK
jgi:hypothetical protein